MNSSNKIDCEHPEYVMVDKKKKFTFWNLMLFCKYCKEPDSMVSPVKPPPESFLHKDSNYMKNNIININKFNTYDPKSFEKKSFLNHQSFFACQDFPVEDETYPENEIFFLQKAGNLMMARILTFNIQKKRHKLQNISKSFTQKSNENKTEDFKILDMISVFSEKLCDHLSKKFKDVQILLTLDVKTSIQVLALFFNNLNFLC
jgi:hypothetical protein